MPSTHTDENLNMRDKFTEEQTGSGRLSALERAWMLLDKVTRWPSTPAANVSEISDRSTLPRSQTSKPHPRSPNAISIREVQDWLIEQRARK